MKKKKKKKVEKKVEKKEGESPEVEDESSPFLAQIIFNRIQDIKRENPEVSRQIDDLEDVIRDSMKEIEDDIQALESDQEQKLTTILVINGIHRTVEGILTAKLFAD